MRSYPSFVLSTAFALFAFLALAAGSAGAAPLPMNGTLTFVIANFGGGSLTGSGVGSSAGGVGTAATVPAGLISVTTTVTVPVTPVALGVSLITLPATPGAPITNAAGSFVSGSYPNGGTLGGAMANNAAAKLYFGPSTLSMTCPGCPVGTVPLEVFGGGGTAMAVIVGIPATIQGAVWSNLGVDEATPTRVLEIQKVSGGIARTVTVTAFDKRTSGGQGTLQLVAPVSVVLLGGGLGVLPAAGVLTLQFVPEPGTLVLVGSGLVGLVAFGRKRARG